MIKCLIRYYFKSTDGRVIRFERPVEFPAVPFIGAKLSLSNDNLSVEEVVFYEDSHPVLVVETETFEQSEAQDIIEDMNELGWIVASDYSRKHGANGKT